MCYGVLGVKKMVGDVHTSAAFIAPLVRLEHEIVAKLKEITTTSQSNATVLTSYIDEWETSTNHDYGAHPLNSFYFFKRIARDFPRLQKILENDTFQNSSQVFESIQTLKKKLMQPTDVDIKGAAWAIARLQEVYDLDTQNLFRGQVLQSTAFKGLDAEDCLLVGEQCFDNLAFDLSEMWTQAAIGMIREKERITKADEARIKESRMLMKKRKMMRELVTTMASKNGKNLHGKFSGLGIPKSFEKVIYENHLKGEQVELIENVFKDLCRETKVETTKPDEEQSCYYSWGRPGKARTSLAPFKKEVLMTNPRMAIYHDVITDKEIKLLQEISYPHLETARVKPYSNKEIMKTIARIGKSAWLKRDKHQLVRTLFARITAMTGLSTKYSEELHVLNYGVGGQYELHIDFYDFINRKPVYNVYADENFKGDQITTVLFYLNDVDAGGSTVFPFLNRGVRPQKGSAVVWYNLNRSGSGNYKTLHASCPVLLGQKWIATLWLNEVGQEFIEPCGLKENE